MNEQQAKILAHELTIEYVKKCKSINRSTFRKYT